ncbi:WD40-repeat-containing domain protein [Phaeosphaeria sp. MPI-PUGE-AT-0046c]|nr:WD40-repeat-containing domain protein [Phaeosphaeria sp. MPI-PUGE-AT-0046c]
MDSHWDLPSLRGTVRLGGPNKPKLNSITVYDVKFYPYTLPGVDPVFAVCGGPHVIVYRCVLHQNQTVEVLYWSENELETSSDGKPVYYNSLAWAQAENGDPLLCVAGSGYHQIKVLNVAKQELVATLIGHGDDINDLAVSPIDPSILASCSIDHSVRLWSLSLAHKAQPLAAVCYGQGHKDQILTLAFHRSGRFILSAGMDTKVIMWVVPKTLKEHAGTDKPAKIHYPHFATTEVHTDFVDCVQWYNDLIFSHACREAKIMLWKIDGFSSDSASIPDAPVPTSAAITSRTPVTVPAHSSSTTRSAWGGRFQRLLQFSLPDTDQFYIRFNLFHELGRHPILAAGNEKSKAFFWDLQRLEDSGTGGDASQDGKATLKGLPRHIREGSVSSNGSSAMSTASGTTKGTKRKVKEQPRDRGIADPFTSIKAHKVVEIPKYMPFPFRQFGWSRDGQWCVGAADHGLINVFHRWEKGVPPVKLESQVVLPMR